MIVYAAWCADGSQPERRDHSVVAESVRYDTLYARCQQFATRVYGPLFTPVCTSGNLASRTTGDITRLSRETVYRALRTGSAAGRRFLSGSILSHDFVEAALMRRAGWGSGLLTISRVLMKNCRLTCL